MNKLNEIIYNATREIFNIEDKINIASLLIFCYGKDNELFAELLYTNNHEEFIQKLNDKYVDYKIDFSINLNNINVKNSLEKVLKEARKIYDSEGFLKALFEKDEYALAIQEIINHKFIL